MDVAIDVKNEEARTVEHFGAVRLGCADDF